MSQESPLGRLGKYELLKELGRGAFGVVYLARDTVLGVERAVKVLHAPLIEDAVMLRRFHREARMAARLEHPHIVPVYDFGEAEGRFYIVMKYMVQGSLKARLVREGRLPWREVVGITRQIAEGLSYAHRHGVVHRDVKPGNVLFDGTGRAAVSDFGLAKPLDVEGDESLSTTVEAIGVKRWGGTPAYMAPEVWKGEEVGPAVDQYALACLVYEMVTGEVLFTGRTIAEVMTKHLVEGPQLPERWPEGVPKGLGELLRKALAPEPGDRYPDVLAFAEALAALGEEASARAVVGRRAGVPGPSQPIETGGEPGQGFRPVAGGTLERRWAVGWVLVGLFLAALVVGVWLGREVPNGGSIAPTVSRVSLGAATMEVEGEPSLAPTRSRTPVRTFTPWPTETAVWTPTPVLPVEVGTALPMESLPVISPENATGVRPLARWGKGRVEDIAWSPDGRFLAVATALGVYLYDTETWTEVAFWETGAWMTSVAFSPDGELLAAGAEDNKVHLWRVDEGRLLSVLEGHTDVVKSVAFSPDGDLLASGSRDGRVILWRVSDGIRLRTLWVGSGVTSVVFSINGDFLATGSLDKIIRLWRISDGTLVYALKGHISEVMSVVFSPDGNLLASGSDDKTVRLWQVADGKSVHMFGGYRSGFREVKSVVFSPDGELLAAGMENGVIRLWWVSDGTLVHMFAGHGDRITSVRFSPDGALLATGSWDGTVRLWRVVDGSVITTLGGIYTHSIFSPNGELLALEAWNSTVHLWRVQDMTLLHILPSVVTSHITFSPKGELLAAGLVDSTVRLWQTLDGRLVHTFIKRTY